ncbi:MAG: VCBS repeat-containing protein [Deltaproteobacteria bacterium]|nr:VCBS repeat-containing protein [Deltaproteobacteria bacterium]
MLSTSACGADPDVDPFATDGGTAGTRGTGMSTADDTAGTADGTATEGGTMPLLDVSIPDAGPSQTCEVVDDMSGVGPCTDTAPPDSFDPQVQWSWMGDGAMSQAITIPLVANLTDDDGNGVIDLCDVPDVVIQVFANYDNFLGTMYVLDGETGAIHWSSETILDASFSPALGDIDGDGIPEIVAVRHGVQDLIAFEHDGTVAWQSTEAWPDFGFSALAMADLDADGTVEILADNRIYGPLGQLLQTLPETTITGWGNATTAADLDGDGDLEVVLGRSAFHHDGALYYDASPVPTGYPQVANLDGDPQPEVLVQSFDGLTVLEHDGTVKFAGLRPTGVVSDGTSWIRPATVHDFDGNGEAEFASSSGPLYARYEADGAIAWMADVMDVTGSAAGTAFDFDGDGVAEAMYGDEQDLFVFDGDGNALLTVSRSSGTLHEYPVVVDVDNDGSAEILVVSNEGHMGNQTAPTLQVIRDVRDRWIPARRIWNQHTYHVTNVREDGTVPMVEPRHWELLNTFRTQAQIESGGICQPPVG